MSEWKCFGNRCVRSDGALVKWDDSSPWPNPAKETARMYTAFEPDPSQKYLAMHRGRTRRAQDGRLFKPGFPRRWKTKEAAMKAVDKEFPIQRGRGHSGGGAEMSAGLHCIRCYSPLDPVLYDDDDSVLVWICGCLALGSFNDRPRVTARYWDKNGPRAAWLLEIPAPSVAERTDP